ncbi:MAG TPA: methyltransferase domain-containing protein [Sphingomicrobium sp.]|nr:methyltransferase domain-containing protein [Sphingomicrobium sp.]
MIPLQNGDPLSRFASSKATARQVLNAGSGPRSNRRLHAVFGPGQWQETRFDVDARAEPDVIGSMTNLRPHFSDASFDAIWSSHSLEHLYAYEIPLALAEFRRILKPDGFALITCPDLETVMTLFLEHGSDHVVYRSAVGPITPLDMMFGHGRSIASGNVHMAHRSGLTAERLGGLLLRAGFAEAITRRQGVDLWALALMDNADRDAIGRKLQATGLNMSA